MLCVFLNFNAAETTACFFFQILLSSALMFCRENSLSSCQQRVNWVSKVLAIPHLETLSQLKGKQSLSQNWPALFQTVVKNKNIYTTSASFNSTTLNILFIFHFDAGHNQFGSCPGQDCFDYCLSKTFYLGKTSRNTRSKMCQNKRETKWHFEM